MAYTPVPDVSSGDFGKATWADIVKDDLADHETRILAQEADVVLGGLLKLKAARVTLTDAQMKALPTTGITLVAAQGSGKRIQLIQASLVTSFAAGAYTNIGGTSPYIVLMLGSNEISTYIANDAIATPAQTKLTTFLSAAAKHVTVFPWSEPETTQGYGLVTPVTVVDANVALSIKAVNDAAGNFTGGNAANTLQVTVLYMVIG